MSLEKHLIGKLQRHGVEAHLVPVGIVHAEEHPTNRRAVHTVVLDAEPHEVVGERVDGSGCA